MLPEGAEGILCEGVFSERFHETKHSIRGKCHKVGGCNEGTIMNWSADRRGESLCWRNLPKYMKDHELQLRPLRISDMQFLKTGLTAEGMLNAGGLGKPVKISGLMAWWLLKRASVCCYCMLVRSRRIGLMSLQNMVLGKSAELSLAILDLELRGCGYGTRAFCLLTDSLTQCSVVEELWVQVNTANGAAVRFWKKLGFVTVREIDSIRMMSKSLVRRDQ
jgi:ribosomal protein S18 acetylase RimI-like enzyme